MDKLFNRVAKSFFLLRPMCNLLTKKKLWPHSFLSEKYLDKTDLFLVKTVIIYAQYCNYIRFLSFIVKNKKWEVLQEVYKRKEVLQLQEHSSKRSILGGERYLGEFIRWIAFQQRRKISFFFLFQRDQFAVFWFRRNMTSQLPVREIFG